MVHRPAFAPLLLVLAPLALASAASGRTTDTVTVYHCTDAQGRLSVRDTPCPRGQQQDTRSMLRPQDPPPKPARIAPDPASPPVTAPAPRVLLVQAPRPLYECVTPDGERYTSDTSDGRPRWVPLWTLGYPLLARRTPLGDRIGAPPARPGDPPLAVVHGPVAGTWVRDTCHALPQAEVCARLVDRRDAIRTRVFNAQQRERDTLRVEERGVNARLANDCGVG